MYVQYKVNVSENQVDTLKDDIRLKKGITLCFPKGGIRSGHVLLLTAAQINRLHKAQVKGRSVQIRLSARQVAKNVSYTGGFIMSLARALTFVARALPTVLSGFATGLLSGGGSIESDYIYCWVNTVDNMEGNSDVSSASTLEAQAIGETGGERRLGL